MAQAGYTAATTRVYLGHVQRFGDHHRRLPKIMGEKEFVHSILHLHNNFDVYRPTYRAASNALGFLYGSVLNLPQAGRPHPRPARAPEAARGRPRFESRRRRQPSVDPQ